MVTLSFIGDRPQQPSPGVNVYKKLVQKWFFISYYVIALIFMVIFSITWVSKMLKYQFFILNILQNIHFL